MKPVARTARVYVSQDARFLTSICVYRDTHNAYDARVPYSYSCFVTLTPLHTHAPQPYSSTADMATDAEVPGRVAALALASRMVLVFEPRPPCHLSHPHWPPRHMSRPH